MRADKRVMMVRKVVDSVGSHQHKIHDTGSEHAHLCEGYGTVNAEAAHGCQQWDQDTTTAYTSCCTKS